MVGNEFIELLPVFDDCRIFKRELVLVGRDVLVIRRPGRVRGNEEITARMQIVVLTDDPRLLVRPDKIERRVKGVEERRMIAVANILHIELPVRSEEHTSELQSLMRTSYAVSCLKKKKKS